MRIVLAQMKISSDVEVNYRKSISLIRVASLNGANKRWNLNCDMWDIMPNYTGKETYVRKLVWKLT